MRPKAFMLALICTFPIACRSSPQTAITKAAEPQDVSVTIYDKAPDHLWNRIHAALWVRTDSQGRQYGHDLLDPLLWQRSNHLLVGPSHDRAIALLEEFIARGGEGLIRDPLKRAFFQRDLWAIFDSVTNRGLKFMAGWWGNLDQDLLDRLKRRQRALQRLLARVILRVALTQDEIAQLPHTYPAAIASAAFARQHNPKEPTIPFLPPELYHAKGPWASISAVGQTTTPFHTNEFSRSIFDVFLSLPKGRDATKKYLKRVEAVDKPWIIPDNGRHPALNPDHPQFPVGTKVALVRRSMVIDDRLNIRQTPIVEKVQLRVYRKIPDDTRLHRRGISRDEQDVYAFLSSRKNLFKGEAGGLRAFGREEHELHIFPIDPFESKQKRRRNKTRRLDERGPRTLATCFGCHSGSGVFSFNTYGDGFGPQRRNRPASLLDSSPETSGWKAIGEKRSRHDWGVLEGLMIEGTAQDADATRRRKVTK